MCKKGMATGQPCSAVSCFPPLPPRAQETDTQGAIWCDRRAKEMILSFRGTQMEWKDLLTDMLIIQEGLDGPDGA